MQKHLSLCTAFLFMALLFTACGSSSDTEVKGGIFKAYTHNFVSDTPLPNVQVYVLDNDTGEVIKEIAPQNSDASGIVTFDLRKYGKAVSGFLCKGVANQSVDTYQFNIETAPKELEKLWLVDLVTFTTAPGGAEMTLEPGKGVAAGSVYWVNPQSQKEEHVGCATLKTEPASGEVRYFSASRLPVSPSQRSSTNPALAYYLFGNINPGKVSIKGFIDGQEIGSTSFFSKPDAICIGNVYADPAKFKANPMPAGCK